MDNFKTRIPPSLLRYYSVTYDKVSQPYPRARVNFLQTRKLCNACGKSVVADSEMRHAVIDGPVVPPKEQDSLGFDQLLFSRRVVEELRAREFSGFEAIRIPVYCVMVPGSLTEIPDAEFYWVKITGTVDVDRKVFNGREDSLCTSCGRWSPRKALGHKVSWGQEIPLPILNDKDQDDLCVFGNLQYGLKMCSPRLMDLQREMKWNGLCFAGVLPQLTYTIQPSENPNWLDAYCEEIILKYPNLSSGS